MGVTIFTIRIEQGFVTALDTSPLEQGIAHYGKNPERTRQLQGTLALAFEGYDDRSEPIVRIPEPRAFLQRAFARIPYLFYYLAPEPAFGNLMLFLGAFANDVSVSVNADGQLQIVPDERSLRALCIALKATALFATENADDADRIVADIVEPLPPDIATYVQRAVAAQD